MNALLQAILVWIVYFGGAALIMHLDASRELAKAKAAGTVDFRDRGIGKYMLLAVVCGPLPIIMYFVGTRRGANGLLIGIGAALGHFVAVVVVATILNVIFQLGGMALR